MYFAVDKGKLNLLMVAQKIPTEMLTGFRQILQMAWKARITLS